MALKNKNIAHFTHHGQLCEDIIGENGSSGSQSINIKNNMKNLIILVCYFGISNLSLSKIRERAAGLKTSIEEIFTLELQEKTNTIIKTVFVPSHETENIKLECIYPKEPDEDIFSKLNLLQEQLKVIENDSAAIEN
jgi:hypothetical protein